MENPFPYSWECKKPNTQQICIVQIEAIFLSFTQTNQNY